MHRNVNKTDVFSLFCMEHDPEHECIGEQCRHMLTVSSKLLLIGLEVGHFNAVGEVKMAHLDWSKI